MPEKYPWLALEGYWGFWSDQFIAQEFGCAAETVASYRKRHGKPKCRDKPKHYALRRKYKKADWRKGNEELAEQFGVTPQHISTVRGKIGKPALKKKVQPRFVLEVLREEPGLPVPEIAKRLGASKTTVRERLMDLWEEDMVRPRGSGPATRYFARPGRKKKE